MDSSGLPKLRDQWYYLKIRVWKMVRDSVNGVATASGRVPHCPSGPGYGTGRGINKAGRQAYLAWEVFLSSQNLNVLRLRLHSPVPACS